MAERGDGEQNGRDRPQIRLRVLPRGDWAPNNDLVIRILAWIDFVNDLGIRMNGFGNALVFLQPENQLNAGNNENHDNVDNLNNDEDNDNNLHGNAHIENRNADNNNNNEDAEDAGAVARVEDGVEVNQGEEEDKDLPGVSGEGPKEEDEHEIEEISSKHTQANEYKCTSDDDSYSTDCDSNNTDKNTGNNPAEVAEEDPLPDPSSNRSRKSKKDVNSPAEHASASAEVSEEDSPPGPSNSRSKKHDEVEDEGSNIKKSRWFDELAHCDSDPRTGCDFGHSSCNDDDTEDTGIVGEIEEEVSQQVGEEDSQPGGSRKRSR